MNKKRKKKDYIKIPLASTYRLANIVNELAAYKVMLELQNFEQAAELRDMIKTKLEEMYD